MTAVKTRISSYLVIFLTIPLFGSSSNQIAFAATSPVNETTTGTKYYYSTNADQFVWKEGDYREIEFQFILESIGEGYSEIIAIDIYVRVRSNTNSLYSKGHRINRMSSSNVITYQIGLNTTSREGHLKILYFDITAQAKFLEDPFTNRSSTHKGKINLISRVSVTPTETNFYDELFWVASRLGSFLPLILFPISIIYLQRRPSRLN